MKDLSLMIKKILNDENLKNELESLENKEQIYDFFVRNGYEGDYDEFCAAMKELFDLFEISDDDLSSVVGGLGANSSKAAATFLSILSLVSSAPSISAGYTSNRTESSSSQKAPSNQPSADDSFLNSFFSSDNKGFFASLKSKFFEKTDTTFVRVDNLMEKLNNDYDPEKNNLDAGIVSSLLFKVIKMVEFNPDNSNLKEIAAEVKKTLLKPIATKLKNGEEVIPKEMRKLVKNVNGSLYIRSSKSRKFKTVDELKKAVEDLIALESSKTYKSLASDEDIKKLDEIIEGISEYYINIGDLNGKTFEQLIKSTGDYKDLKKKKKSVYIKNILKKIKSYCNNDVEFKNGTIKAAGKDDSATFINMDMYKIYKKLDIGKNLPFVKQLKTACDYSNHVYMFEKSDKYEYDPEKGEYTKLTSEESNETEENKSNQQSEVDESSPYFGYFGDNFAGSVDIITKGEEEGTLYVTFRGTYSKDDALIDSDFTKLECNFLGGKCVHRGFLNRYLQLQEGMKKLIREKVHDYNKDIKKIVVTGHSLGGALSTLAALDFQQDQKFIFEGSSKSKKIPVNLITFCSPRVLSFEAYDYVMEHNKIFPQDGENSAVRIYRHGDVVASIPLGSMGYKHFGEVYCITNAPSGFESSSKTMYSKIKSYFSLEDWKKWVASFVGYHSITGILEDVSKLGKDKNVTMYKELF